MASEEYKADMEDLSDCCGASIVWTDICSDCKEHCGIEGEDEPEGDTPEQENEWLRSGGFQMFEILVGVAILYQAFVLYLILGDDDER